MCVCVCVCVCARARVCTYLEMHVHTHVLTCICIGASCSKSAVVKGPALRHALAALVSGQGHERICPCVHVCVRAEETHDSCMQAQRRQLRLATKSGSPRRRAARLQALRSAVEAAETRAQSRQAAAVAGMAFALGLPEPPQRQAMSRPTTCAMLACLLA